MPHPVDEVDADAPPDLLSLTFRRGFDGVSGPHFLFCFVWHDVLLFFSVFADH